MHKSVLLITNMLLLNSCHFCLHAVPHSCSSYGFPCRNGVLCLSVMPLTPHNVQRHRLQSKHPHGIYWHAGRLGPVRSHVCSRQLCRGCVAGIAGCWGHPGIERQEKPQRAGLCSRRLKGQAAVVGQVSSEPGHDSHAPMGLLIGACLLLLRTAMQHLGLAQAYSMSRV